jgi:Fe2+ transport system protein FeoA
MINSNQSEIESIQPISLIMVSKNKQVEVIHVFAGYRATQRLGDLGIIPGTIISVITQAPFHGPIQIAVRGTRLAIGHGLAEKIFVKYI